MIKIKSVEFRNFLSYGNQWTKLNITPGVNLIVGEDKEKKRSNASGKTSLLETIPFALFGQTIKDIKKSQIPNWRNEKNCEVKINFITEKGDDVVIHRGIKPNILNVHINGEKLETTSRVTEFQKDIEESLIGMDIKTFSNIVHSNPNNSISIFDTPKAQKRVFLERLFNLESYTKLTVHINEKLRNLNDVIIRTESDLRNLRTTNETLNSQLEGLKNESNDDDINKLSDKILKLNLELGDFIDENKDKLLSDGKTDEYTEKIKVLTEQVENIKVQIKDQNSKRNDKKLEISKQENKKDLIGDLSEKRAKVKKIEKRILELEETDFDSEIDRLKDEIKHLKDTISELETKKESFTVKILDYKAKIQNLPNVDELSGKSNCPTCGNDVDYEQIKDQVEKDKNDYTRKIKQQEQSLYSVIDSIDDKKEKIDNIEQQISNLKDKQKLLITLKEKIETVDLDSKEKELEEISSKIDELNVELEEISSKIDELEENESIIKDEISDLKSKIETHNEISRTAIEKEKEIQSLKERIKIFEKYEKERQKKIKEQEHLINLNNENIEEAVKSQDRNTIIKDYLEFIKQSLKDENVKQYAISNILPFLNKQTNHYLSETGHSFYLLIDGWMEAEIKGLGMRDCSFGNLSGGESKSIDLAIKFACIDIARMMSTASANILILDEILDTSIDSYGIQQLMDIVYYKQKKDNLAVYLISHREEINELGIDNIIRVEKENGFSKIVEWEVKNGR